MKVIIELDFSADGYDFPEELLILKNLLEHLESAGVTVKFNPVEIIDTDSGKSLEVFSITEKFKKH